WTSFDDLSMPPSTHVIVRKFLPQSDHRIFGALGGGLLFRLLRLESTRSPRRSQTAQQERNRGPEENNRYGQEIPRARQRLGYSRERQVDRPAHNPGSGYEEPKPKHASTPIDSSRFSEPNTSAENHAFLPWRANSPQSKAFGLAAFLYSNLAWAIIPGTAKSHDGRPFILHEPHWVPVVPGGTQSAPRRTTCPNVPQTPRDEAPAVRQTPWEEAAAYRAPLASV